MKHTYMRKPVACIIFSSVLTVATMTHADIYKWVDENGQVHYGDKPGDDSSEQLSVEEKSVDQLEQDNAGDNRLEYQKRLLDSYATERRQKQEEKAKQDKQQAEQKQKCERARKRLASYENAGLLYTRDEQGERVILNDEQHQTAMEKARAAVRQHCK